uniref:hypothetical protein n=1 Tax=Nonomuraea sp. CA-252377 TaxID=3240003 RepID=UPI003F493C5E
MAAFGTTCVTTTLGRRRTTQHADEGQGEGPEALAAPETTALPEETEPDTGAEHDVDAARLRLTLVISDRPEPRGRGVFVGSGWGGEAGAEDGQEAGRSLP